MTPRLICSHCEEPVRKHGAVIVPPARAKEAAAEIRKRTADG
jgi:hypothetical protein